MKISSVVLLLTFCVSTTVHARGGAIGGGEVNTYPLFSCTAQSMDPTFPSQAASLVVMGEATYEGFLMPDISVTIALSDAKGHVLSYLPTVTAARDFDPNHLEIYEFAQTLPGEANTLMGTLQVSNADGYLTPSIITSQFEELQLTNCQYIAVAQPK